MNKIFEKFNLYWRTYTIGDPGYYMEPPHIEDQGHGLVRGEFGDSVIYGFSDRYNEWIDYR